MTTTVLSYLDTYCERAGDPALLAEPLNALTNLAFIVAAALAARALMRAPGSPQRDLWGLAALLGLIGMGSGLWHSFARPETMLADVIPIALFINLYLLSALRRLFSLRWQSVTAWWGLYQAVSVTAQLTLPADTLHGSVMYLPTFAALGVMTIALQRRRSPVARVFWRVMAVWSASLLFRTVDLELCAALPMGTHFLWHLLNAWVLWRLLMALMPGSVAERNAT